MFGKNYFLKEKCSIHKHKKGNKIYIWQESMNILKSNIYKYIHKDMLYKIDSQNL